MFPQVNATLLAFFRLLLLLLLHHGLDFLLVLDLDANGLDAICHILLKRRERSSDDTDSNSF